MSDPVLPAMLKPSERWRLRQRDSATSAFAREAFARKLTPAQLEALRADLKAAIRDE